MMPFCFPLNAEQFELAARKSDSSDYSQYVDEIITAFTKEMKAQFGLEGEGKKREMSHDVEEISVRLVAYQKGTIEQAREWEIKATERLVEMVNAHEKIRPFLREYPFHPDRAIVSITFLGPDNGPRIDDNIAFVIQSDYNVHYFTRNPLNIFVYRNIKIEPYLEAFDIAQTRDSIIAEASKSKDLPRDEVFPPRDGKIPPLHGKIVNGRYYSPENIFSCQAEDYGERKYVSQDALSPVSVSVAFYGPIYNFKKAEVIFMPGTEDKQINEVGLKDFFEHLGIGILEKVDNAQGIKVLEEELLEGDTLFAAISVDKISFLRHPSGKYMCSTRAYLVFQDKDKIVILSNQEVTLPGEKHTPEKHIERLKTEILDFRKTFEFGPIPTRFCTENIEDLE